MTRDEHLAWAKADALKHLEHGPNYNVANAVTTMLCDLDKHEELRGIAEKMGTFGFLIASRSETDARRFIEGFR
ncbi:MAG: hypothetical protein ABSG29_09670 [Steroidobacteraceae bacterium]|jgi:hypothetical protein